MDLLLNKENLRRVQGRRLIGSALDQGVIWGLHFITHHNFLFAACSPVMKDAASCLTCDGTKVTCVFGQWVYSCCFYLVRRWRNFIVLSMHSLFYLWNGEMLRKKNGPLIGRLENATNSSYLQKLRDEMQHKDKRNFQRHLLCFLPFSVKDRLAP